MEPPPGHAHGLTAPLRTSADGPGPTRGEAAGFGWRRTSRGLYVPAHVQATAPQRVLEAGVLVPTYGAVTGWGALAWRGARWSNGRGRDGSTPLPVPIALSRSTIRDQAGLRLCRERWAPEEVEVVDGVRVTSAVRSVCFEMRYAADLTAAVVALDMAAYDDLVSAAEVAGWMAGHPSYTGIEQGRQAAALGCENAWSPMEARSRTTWVVDAALPTPLANQPLFDLTGRHLVTPDLFDPDAGVVGEYHGRDHTDPARRRQDRDRRELYQRLGLVCVEIMEGDLGRRGEVAGRLRAAYGEAAARRLPRAWTLEQPHWWVDTSSVDLRRALDDEQRRIWLRYRR